MTGILGGLIGSYAGVAGDDFELIQTLTANGTQQSLSFTNIPQGYKHLQLRIVAKVTTTTLANSRLVLTLNNYTTADQTWYYFGYISTATAAASGTASANMRLGRTNATETASHWSGQIVEIPNYTDSTRAKTIKSFAGSVGSTPEIALASGYSPMTTAVNRIDIAPNAAAPFVSGTRMSLYGIRG